MKRHLRRTSVRVVLVVVSAFGTMLWTVDAVWSMQEPKEVARMERQMKTVCVGRFLIDVPLSAHVSIGSAAIDGINIINYGKETADEFSRRITLREDEINSEKNKAGLKNLESVQEIRHDTVRGKILVFNRKSSYYFSNGEKIPTLTVSINGYAYVNGMSIGFIASIYKPEDVVSLTKLLERIEPMEEGSFPRQPGFCLDRVFVRDPLSAEQGERVVMFAGLPGHGDLGIAMSTMAGMTPGPGLIKRNTANRAGPYAFLNVLTSTLLEGHRTINGLEGDELAFKARERNFSTGYAFDWESQGTENDVLRPFISLELQTGISPRAGGEPVQSTMSEESLGDLWRRMSSSVRLRPVDQPVHDRDAGLQLGLALGTPAWAGQSCQQSGWWQCGDADAELGVFGGERQFLREGAVMPQALLLPRPSVWQKVRGLQPSYEAQTPTSWRLADKRIHGRRSPAAGLAQPVTIAVAVAPAPGNDNTPAVPGRTLRSAALCPASGWWRCVDELALDGTRWFARGTAFPPATYRFSTGGGHRTAQPDQLVVRQSGWELMRITEAPAQATEQSDLNSVVGAATIS